MRNKYNLHIFLINFINTTHIKYNRINLYSYQIKILIIYSSIIKIFRNTHQSKLINILLVIIY
jgi:hypothetical protein